MASPLFMQYICSVYVCVGVGSVGTVVSGAGSVSIGSGSDGTDVSGTDGRIRETAIRNASSREIGFFTFLKKYTPFMEFVIYKNRLHFLQTVLDK